MSYLARNALNGDRSHKDSVIDLTEEVEIIPKPGTPKRDDWKTSYTFTALHDPKSAPKSTPLKTTVRKLPGSTRVVDFTSNVYKQKPPPMQLDSQRNEHGCSASLQSTPRLPDLRSSREIRDRRNHAFQTSYVDLAGSEDSDETSRGLQGTKSPRADHAPQTKAATPILQKSTLDTFNTDANCGRESSFVDPFASDGGTVDPFSMPNSGMDQGCIDLFAFDEDNADDFSRAVASSIDPNSNSASSIRAAPVANMISSSTSAAPIKNSSGSIVQQETTKLPPLQNMHSNTIGKGLNDKRHISLEDDHDALQEKREARRFAMETEKKRFAAREREDLAAMTRQTTLAGAPKDHDTRKGSKDNSNRQVTKLGFAALEDIHEQAHSSDTVSDENGHDDRERAGCHCPICDAKLSSRYAVKNHFITCVQKNGNPEGKAWDSHKSCQKPKTRRFQASCPICKIDIDRPSRLQEHFRACARRNGNPNGMSWDDCVKSGHNVDEEESNQASGFRCPLCDACFTQRYSIKRHLLQVHRVTEESLSTEQSGGPEKNSLQIPIDIFANGHPQKQPRTQLGIPTIGQSILQPNRKRMLQDLSPGTLYAPKQIASKNEFQKYTEAARRKFDKRLEKAEKLNLKDDASKTREDSGGRSIQDVQNVTFPATEVPIVDSLMEVDSGSSSPNSKTSDSQAPSSSDITVDDTVKLGSTARISNDTPPALQNQFALPQALRKVTTSIAHQKSVDNTTSIPADLHQANDEGTEAEPRLPLRPTTGGKGISAATLAIWEARDKEVEETLETPAVIYVYFVTLRYYGNGLPDEEANTHTMGPYHTLIEANAVANNEVKYLDHLEHPFEIQLNEGQSKFGWAYHHVEDEYGMQTHTLSLGGFHAEAAVHRGTSQGPVVPRSPTHRQ